MSTLDPVCAQECHYGTCSEGPYGCAGCCRCLGPCAVTELKRQGLPVHDAPDLP